jgi:hypothetical protein
MFRDCSVNPRWVTKWLQLGKIKWETAEKHYVYCAGNCLGNLKNLQCFRSKMKEYSLLERKTHIQAALRQEMTPFPNLACFGREVCMFQGTVHQAQEPLQVLGVVWQIMHWQDAVCQVVVW